MLYLNAPFNVNTITTGARLGGKSYSCKNHSCNPLLQSSSEPMFAILRKFYPILYFVFNYVAIISYKCTLNVTLLLKERKKEKDQCACRHRRNPQKHCTWTDKRCGKLKACANSINTLTPGAHGDEQSAVHGCEQTHLTIPHKVRTGRMTHNQTLRQV